MRLTVITHTHILHYVSKYKVTFRKSWVALKRAVSCWVIKPSCLQAPPADDLGHHDLLFYLSGLGSLAPSLQSRLLLFKELPLLAGCL